MKKKHYSYYYYITVNSQNLLIMVSCNVNLLNILSRLADKYPDLIDLNVASRATSKAICVSSFLFIRRREIGRFLETYRSLGFTINIEINKDDNSNFTYEIIKFKISLPKEDINIEIQNNKFNQSIVSETYYKVMRDLGFEIAQDDAKNFMDDYIMDLENGMNKTNIIRTIRKNIQENVHSYLWRNILTCSFLSTFIIGETLDLRDNNLQEVPDNFVKYSASKIDLRGNNLQQVPEGFEHMKNLILDYRTECRFLSEQIQNERERFRLENPININAIQKHDNCKIALIKTNRADVGDVYRLVRNYYGKENLSDSEIMQIVINMHANGINIHYDEVNEYQLTRDYNIRDDVRMTQLASARAINPNLKKDFSGYFT